MPPERKSIMDIGKKLVMIQLIKVWPLCRKGRFAFLIGMLLLPLVGFAQGNLLVTPRRVVFEGNKQREEIVLVNTDRDTATYSISFLQYRMTDDGAFEEITEPPAGQFLADPYLRYFPRSVKLAPNESQVIRMQVRRLPDMAEGEYRSHLYFRSVPSEKPLGEEDVLPDSTSIGVRLTPIYGVSIPVIIRIGNLDSKVTINDLTVEQEENQPPVVKMTLNREGNQSVYGDLSIDYIAPDGETINVGIVRGLAVYTPNTLRRFSMPLNVPDGVDFSAGKLLIRYSSSNEAKPVMYAEKEFVLTTTFVEE
jgi:P pilus assembly chaperone PapD